MVAANGIYKLAVIGTVHGQQHVHTLNFRSTTAGASVASSEEAWQQELIDTWQTACRTTYREIFWQGAHPTQLYQVRKVCGSVPLPAGLDEAEAVGSTEGTNDINASTGEMAAPWLANVVTERTGNSGRSYRGRFFLGGLAEGDLIGSDINSGRLANTTAYTAALLAAFVTPSETTVNHKLFVFSRVLADGKPATPTEPAVPPVPCQAAGADVRSFQVRPYLCTMKSRKIGSGI